MATELVKPTSTATKPAVADETLRSRKKDMKRFCPGAKGLYQRVPRIRLRRSSGTAPQWGVTRRQARRGGRQISTLDPSSTTALAGRLRNAAAPAALWCMAANSFSRHGAMPPCSVGVTTSRERK